MLEMESIGEAVDRNPLLATLVGDDIRACLYQVEKLKAMEMKLGAMKTTLQIVQSKLVATKSKRRSVAKAKREHLEPINEVDEEGNTDEKGEKEEGHAEISYTTYPSTPSSSSSTTQECPISTSI